MYAIYENEGTFDIRAASIMGLNVKPNTGSPIGYFGTGLKYAIAVILRNGCGLSIQTGEGESYRAAVRKTQFRGTDIQECLLIRMGGGEITLPYTTEHGKNWELWQAIRELECNSRDEGGRFYLSGSIPLPELNKVRIIVSGDKFINALEQRKTIFFDQAAAGAPVAQAAGILYAPKPSQYVYYRGIRVLETTGAPFGCTMNILSQQKLTEDRTLGSMFAFSLVLKDALESDINLLSFLANTPEAGEWKVMAGYGYINLSDEAVELLSRRKNLPKLLQDEILKRRLEKIPQEDIKLTVDREKTIREAVGMLCRYGYKCEYPIRVRRRLSQDARGLANLGTHEIFLAESLFEEGFPAIVATLFEEFAHLEYGHRDETREFQDWLVRQCAVLMGAK